MSKHTIYLSDADEVLLESWKPSLNLSQLLSEAVRNKVELLELQRKMKPKAFELLKRLKEEEKSDFQTGAEEGTTAGTQWAMDIASLNDLRSMSQAEGNDDASMVLESDQNDDWRPHIAYIEDEFRSEDYVAWCNGYLEGFRKSAQRVWKLVSEHF